MKKEVVIGIIGLLVVVALTAVFFKDQVGADEPGNRLYEITTINNWQTAAYAPNCPTYPQQQYNQYQAQQAAYPSQNCPTYPQGYQQYNQYQPQNFQPVAMPGAPPITADQDRPVLIKIMGIEAIEMVGERKVKAAGVMGSSWAEKSGLKAGDILLNFDAKDITSLKQFMELLAAAPPEKDYKLSYMRDTRKKKTVLFVGEGEMEGFTPIPVPKQ